MLHRRFARFATVSSVVLIASALVALPATAAPKRAELGPQAEMGPSLHPSGKDRTEEKGGSGTQGKSQSDPDGMYNYGEDKPGGAGGLYTGDQDGNNGCGNDQDFEDDNNGNCGGLKRTECVPTDSKDPGSEEIVEERGKSAGRAKGKKHVAVACPDSDSPSDDSSSDDTFSDSVDQTPVSSGDGSSWTLALDILESTPIL